MNPFSNDAVPLALLRQRAFNHRWASQPAGVIPLTAADPDFAVCPAIQEALIRYVTDGVFSYAPPAGLPRYREAVAQGLSDLTGLPRNPDDVIATDGVAAALAIAARGSLAEGDEVLIPDPVDFLFRHTIERAGARAIAVPLARDGSAEAFLAALAERVTPRTRMVWLCNPHNPLGLVHDRQWLEAVAHWALERRIRMLVDEVWSDIVYPPHRHVCIAALGADVAGNSILVNGFSKSFGLAGLRVGFIVCTAPHWRERLLAASDAPSTVTGVSVLSQVAAIAALETGQPWLKAFVAHLQAQRDYVVDRLVRWPGVQVFVPQGTYTVFPDIRSLGIDPEQFCQQVAERANVALVPGSPRWFGPGALGHVRLSFATSREILEEAFDRIDRVFD